MRESEMEEHLLKVGISDERISNAIEYIYHGDDINRCSASEIKGYIMNSGMVIRRYCERVTFSRKWALDQKGPSELTQDIKDRIAATQYNPMDLGIVYMRAELEKYENL